MPTVAPCPPPTPLALSGGRSDSTPEVDPAATTVAMVAETGTRWGTAARVAAEVHHCVQADRAVRVSYALTGGADLQPVWPGRIGVVSR